MDFVGASGIHTSSLQTSSDSSLGGLADALGGLATALGGLTATPDDVLFVGGGGRSAFLKTAQGLELFGNVLEQGNICQRGGAFWQSGAARRSRARSCSVAIRDGHCDNDDATFDKFRSYILGERSGSRVPLVVRERAVARSRFATGTVTMTTRHSTNSVLIYWGTCSSYRRI